MNSSLDIHSLLKPQPVKHNVIERDKILVPSNWDSWGKIRIIREGFDMEGISSAWSVAIDETKQQPSSFSPPPDENGEVLESSPTPPLEPELSDPAVSMYEQSIRDPQQGSLASAHQRERNAIEVESVDTQSFLATQYDTIEKMRSEDEAKRADDFEKRGTQYRGRSNPTDYALRDYIGPVQMNMGGVQVDADDMVSRMKGGGLFSVSSTHRHLAPR